MSSARARELVVTARERQAARLRAEGVALNAHMNAAALGRHAILDERCEGMLRAAREQGMLSPRGQHRVMRVARTIADLNGSERIGVRELGSALALRGDASAAGKRAA